jgi:RNA polymerase sigma-70 factor (ECF subfamily)
VPLDSAEIALITDAMNGSRKAFEELIILNQSFVLNLARKFGPREEMESVAQETFISAFKAISSLNDPLAFKGWLHQIAVRRCHDAWRAVYRKKPEVSLESLQENSVERRSAVNFSGTSNVEIELQGKMEVDTILNQLSADDRMIMTLLYLEDKTTKEVAKLLGLSVVNVKVRSHRIKKRLLKLSQIVTDSRTLS